MQCCSEVHHVACIPRTAHLRADDLRVHVGSKPSGCLVSSDNQVDHWLGNVTSRVSKSRAASVEGKARVEIIHYICFVSLVR